MSTIITSIKNPLIKQMRKLHRPKQRQEENLFLLEGTNLLELACKVNYNLETVCYTSNWQQRYPQLAEEVGKQAQRLELVSDEVLKAIATTVNPDGIVASAKPAPLSLPTTNISLGLVVERLQDPGNLGTIIRTAVASQVDTLWLSSDSVDIYNPKVLRASAGEWFRLPMAISNDLTQLVKNYQQQGLEIIATLPTASKTYWDIDLTQPSLILLGNESGGLSPELASLATQQVKIPLANGVESLNVAIATALLLYEQLRQTSRGVGE